MNVALLPFACRAAVCVDLLYIYVHVEHEILTLRRCCSPRGQLVTIFCVCHEVDVVYVMTIVHRTADHLGVCGCSPPGDDFLCVS